MKAGEPMKRNHYFQSADNKTMIHCIIWEPEQPPIATMQLIHGMAEYINRYDAFAQYLNQQGILVIGHDHLGHGQSIHAEHPHGFFHEDGPATLIADVREVTRLAKKITPDCPLFILGHSMGSFILRNYLKTDSEQFDGAIIMGTSGAKPEIKPVLSLTKQLNKFKPKVVNHTLDSLAFGSYSRYFPNDYSKFNWLSKNQENVRDYEAHPKTGFVFTNNGFHTLFTLLDQATKPRWYEPIRHDLPLLIISGEKDPVGQMGKGPRKLAQTLANEQFTDVTLAMFHDLRHEILNEKEADQVYELINKWLTRHL